MIYGYVRVSTKEQHIDRQMKSLIDFGVPKENIKVDKESGKDFDRTNYLFFVYFSIKELKKPPSL